MWSLKVKKNIIFLRIFFEVNKKLSTEKEIEIYTKCSELCENDLLFKYAHKFAFNFLTLPFDEEKVCLERIKKRNRRGEDLLTLEYLHLVSEKQAQMKRKLEKHNFKIQNCTLKVI